MAYKEIRPAATYQDTIKVSFEQPGECVEGTFEDFFKLTSREGDSFNKYVVKSNGELKSFLGCYQLDSTLPTLLRGTQIKVTYQGKEKIKGGKSVKVFQILADDSTVATAAQ